MVQHWSVEDGLSQNTVMCMLQDKQGFMWFGTWDGLNRLDGYTFSLYKSAESERHNSRIDMIYEDESEQLWWRTYDHHYYRLNPSRTEITSHYEQEIPEGMRQKIKHLSDTLYVDKRGIIWLADQKPGIKRYRNGQWKRFVPKQDIRFKGQAQRHFFVLEDNQGRTWVNPTGGGFGYYDYENDRFVCPLRSTSTIHSAYFDREGLLWISTYDKGVDCLDLSPQPFIVHDLSIWEKKNGEIRAMALLKDGTVKMVEKDERMIYSIVETKHGLLYGSRWNGILDANYPLKNKAVYDMELLGDTLFVATYGGGGCSVFKGYQHIRTIGDGLNARCVLNHHGKTWVGTTSGLIEADQHGERFIPSNDIRSLYYYDGLWVGTFGGGLYKLVGDSLIGIEGSEPIVLGIAGLGEHIWMSSEEGITEMNLNTGEHRYYHVLEKGRNAYFGEAKPLIRPDSVVLFGYSQGYIEFDTRHPHTPIQPIPLRIIKTEIEKSLLVHYAALEYVDPSQIEYSYYLEGIEKEWKPVGKQRFAHYESLKHGKYTLHIRSTNRRGEWLDNEQTVNFEVPQSIWSRWWMFIIYLLVLSALLCAMAYASGEYTKMRQELAMEGEMNQLKLQFFTNISHELRTPLTLISGPVENILRSEKISPSVRSQLEIVQSNEQRMLRMINQILDFRKIQNKKMKLRIQQAHLFDIINHTVANFNKEAEDRQIRLQIVQKTEKDLIWVDREKVDTILFNLLSNAFKYTENGKAITVILDERENFVLMMVKDEGQGIPKDQRSVLFDRFASHNAISTDKPGTGIGLNLVKELVDLHHGFIEVDSQLGKGSTFTVMFRRGADHFDNEVEMIVDDQSDRQLIGTSALDDIERTAQKRSTKKIMVVDDNEDMRSFLIAILGSEFDVVDAKDGAAALKKIKQEMPDLIISDLMMPNMGGLELTQRMKQQEDLRYIPIILLTAKSAIESRLEAMEYGADDYVTKPFEPEYLKARVRNIMIQREQLEQVYRDRLQKLEPNQAPTTETETDTFLAKLLGVMEKEMDNNELTVDNLVEAMGLGRTVFFNRLKTLTGMNPVEFIREIRIKRAAQLLESGKYNVSEVTYMVGMNDSRYFSKCFKATYGKTPTEYKKQYEK